MQITRPLIPRREDTPQRDDVIDRQKGLHIRMRLAATGRTDRGMHTYIRISTTVVVLPGIPGPGVTARRTGITLSVVSHDVVLVKGYFIYVQSNTVLTAFLTEMIWWQTGSRTLTDPYPPS